MRHLARSSRTAALGAVLVLALTACSGGAGGDAGAADDGATLGSTAAPERPTVPEVPPPSPAGTGVVVIGGVASSFAVTSCALEPAADEPEGARTLLRLEGAGTTGPGVEFTIEIQRFATGTDVVTYTDTVTYTDSARILQAQRVEVGGQITDLRDERAATPLLRPRADGVSGAGFAGPPGEVAGGEGITGLALDATC